MGVSRHWKAGRLAVQGLSSLDKGTHGGGRSGRLLRIQENYTALILVNHNILKWLTILLISGIGPAIGKWHRMSAVVTMPGDIAQFTVTHSWPHAPEHLRKQAPKRPC